MQNHEQIAADMHRILTDAGFNIPSIEEIKAQNAARNARAQQRNQRVVEGAIGKVLRVKVGKNEFVTGTIVEAELTSAGQAKIMLQCQGRTNPELKVKRGPYFVSKLPR